MAQSLVQKAAAGSCSGLQNQKILRTEQYCGENAAHLPVGPFFNTIQKQLPGLPAGEEKSPQALLPGLPGHIPLQVCKFASKPNELHFPPGSKGPACGQIEDRFQKIGFSLGVISHNQIDAGRKTAFQSLIVPEIPKCQPVKLHGLLPHRWRPGRRRYPRALAFFPAWCRPLHLPGPVRPG